MHGDELERSEERAGPGRPPVAGDLQVPRAAPLDSRALALGLIAILATFHTLQIAADLLMPIVFALLGRFALSPVMRGLVRVGVPPLLGAMLIVATLAGLAIASARVLSDPTTEWLERAPQVLRDVGRKIRLVQQPVAEVVEATKEVEDAALGSDEGSEERVVVQSPSILEDAIDRAGSIVVTLTVTAALLFFLLAAGNQFGRKLSLLLPQTSDPRHTQALFMRIERDVSRHLFTISLINGTLGVVVALAMWALSMPNPMLWGVLAGLLNFVPFLGAAVTAVVVTMVSLITFEDLTRTVLVTSIYVTLTGLEGLLITPTLLGRRLTLSPTAVFVSVLVWSWLWGIMGAVIAVPLLATLRIVCAYVTLLAPLGVFLGNEIDAPAPPPDAGADDGGAEALTQDGVAGEPGRSFEAGTPS